MAENYKNKNKNEKNEKNKNKKSEKVRVYVDGIYDLFHFGHACFLEQAKNLFPNAYLLVGCCNDETTLKYKGKTAMTAAERYESLRHCKWVDEVIPDAPWVISQEFLDKHEIDFVAHDSLPSADTSGAGNDVYEFVKAVGKFKEIQRTDGISTSNIIMRIVKDYDQYVMRNLDQGYSRKDLVVSYVKEAALDSLQILKDTSSDRDLKSKKSKKLHSGKKRKSLHIEVTESEADPIEIEGKKRPKKAHLLETTIEERLTKQKSYIDGSLSKSANAIDEKHKSKKSSTANEESDSDGIENQNQKESLPNELTNKESHSNSSEEEREVAPQIEKPGSGVEKQPNNGALWAQKSSWTDLVGGTNVSFSISQLLHDTKFEEQEQPKNWFDAKPMIDKSSEKVTKSTNGVAFPDVGSKSSLKVVKQRAVRAPLSYSVGDTCSFMRSDASMKEWKNAKAALNASLRKKIDKKK